ncbi:2Fe-2S iron-sulfur cluster binding domain-containing protein [Ilyomonas limi]|uniref:2Fe-2S iron-sulfur cluster binding domain-containing protein n=1 Tax=Ilyomonas limi TaxID=2575867 RepID=A0A4U3L9C0_9BACT|nr:2Fe-2S iron-sulfur cluster-binding protein [Ilyomonas limi]TKK71672.1 2Fe-2S iron-sulfur cluster binding domain-containing protein [Ilyomonas limi]
MNEQEPFCPNESRRSFLKKSTVITAVALTPAAAINAANNHWDEHIAAAIENVSLSVEINGTRHTMDIDPRTSLLDLLRENLHLTGTKKGCDYGQCGACTVHVNGERVLSCLTLAATTDGSKVTTIEGLANGDELHPMQAAFIKHDGFQCGYCTPGQIMSAVACIREGHASSRDQIREYMSGNICRCGAYPNIVDAIEEVQKGGQKV